jgi:hypothetical protein
MGIAALLFGLVVGFFHFNQSVPLPEQQEMLAAEPQAPAGYESGTEMAADLHRTATQNSAPAGELAANGDAVAAPFVRLTGAEDVAGLAQAVADIVAGDPGSAGKVISIAMAQVDGEASLGDVATLAAAATKAAPDQAASIAGAVARSLSLRSHPALAAAVATIVSLVPEQVRDIGLVVGAVVGENPRALGMIAQTVAIATGEASFSSLSEGSGVAIGALMRESTRLGIDVPFQVPAYAAQLAPVASQVAEGAAAQSGENAADSSM